MGARGDVVHPGWCRVMYNTLLDMYGKVGHIDSALAIHEEMRQAGWKTDVVREGQKMVMRTGGKT